MLYANMLSQGTVDPLTCAIFLVIAFTLAGLVHTIWLRSRLSQRFRIPLDLGGTFRGKRILGDNKTLRGFMVIVPAAACSFLILGTIVSSYPDFSSRLWALSPDSYAFLGLVAGFGFMIGELPNSFIKRQLGIRPGGAPVKTGAKVLFFALDRFDSIVGMLLAISLIVPTPWRLWLYVALLGPCVHWLFSVILYWYGVKERPA
jgi:hypothetical protein